MIFSIQPFWIGLEQIKREYKYILLSNFLLAIKFSNQLSNSVRTSWMYPAAGWGYNPKVLSPLLRLYVCNSKSTFPWYLVESEPKYYLNSLRKRYKWGDEAIFTPKVSPFMLLLNAGWEACWCKIMQQLFELFIAVSWRQKDVFVACFYRGLKDIGNEFINGYHSSTPTSNMATNISWLFGWNTSLFWTWLTSIGTSRWKARVSIDR